MKIPVIATPTREIFDIVQKRTIELGYKWDFDLGYFVLNYKVGNIDKNSYICLGNNKTLYLDVREYYFGICKGYYEEITMYDLFQMEVDVVTVKDPKGEIIDLLKKWIKDLENLNINQIMED